MTKYMESYEGRHADDTDDEHDVQHHEEDGDGDAPGAVRPPSRASTLSGGRSSRASLLDEDHDIPSSSDEDDNGSDSGSSDVSTQSICPSYLLTSIALGREYLRRPRIHDACPSI